jgi:hypothetical protein
MSTARRSGEYLTLRQKTPQAKSGGGLTARATDQRSLAPAPRRMLAREAERGNRISSATGAKPRKRGG